jgi:hypothetical protein
MARVRLSIVLDSGARIGPGKAVRAAGVAVLFFGL